jgi:hypothetical protein
LWQLWWQPLCLLRFLRGLEFQRWKFRGLVRQLWLQLCCSLCQRRLLKHVDHEFEPASRFLSSHHR